MSTHLRVVKGALRNYVYGNNIHALLELDAVIEKQPDCWVAYSVRGRVHAALKRYQEAIADYTLLLEREDYLNTRNRKRLVQSIALFNKLARANDCSSVREFKKASGAGPNQTGAGTAGFWRIDKFGKFLLDTKDISTIQKLISGQRTAQSNVNRLMLEAYQELKELLQKIDEHPGVIGSCIIGYGGSVIVNTLPDGYDPESIGIRAMGVYLHSTDVMDKLGHKRVHQIIMRSEQGYVIVADFGGGVLITISHDYGKKRFITLMRQITLLIAEQ